MKRKTVLMVLALSAAALLCACGEGSEEVSPQEEVAPVVIEKEQEDDGVVAETEEGGFDRIIDVPTLSGGEMKQGVRDLSTGAVYDLAIKAFGECTVNETTDLDDDLNPTAAPSLLVSTETFAGAEDYVSSCSMFLSYAYGADETAGYKSVSVSARDGVGGIYQIMLSLSGDSKETTCTDISEGKEVEAAYYADPWFSALDSQNAFKSDLEAIQEQYS